MIKRLISPNELAELPCVGMEVQKIHALLNAYGTKYDFCRFYSHGCGGFLSEMDGSYVLYRGQQTDYEELAQFLLTNGFVELFCAEEDGDALGELIGAECIRINEMLFSGVCACANTKIDCAPSLCEVYFILKTAFEIDFDSWYTDMSHRIRHGVSQFRRLSQSVLAIQHDFCGEALISQVATHPDYREQGTASRLVGAVCAELSPSRVYVLCEDSLVPFYKKIGFEQTSVKCLLRQSGLLLNR